MRWLLIGGLLAIAVGTLGLTGTTVATSLGGHGSMMARATMGNDPGRMMGQMMAGAASRYLPEERARSLADQVPEGASADGVAERLTFRTASVRLEVLGSPQGGPEMSFRIAGLINPTISVPRGATIELEFINGDPDTSHGWELKVSSWLQQPEADRHRGRPEDETAGLLNTLGKGCMER